MSKRKQINQTAASYDLQAVLAALREAPEGLTAPDLAEELDLTRAEQKAVAQLLNQLQGIGLLRRYGQSFRWVHSPRVQIGTIRQRRRKTISFIPDDLQERVRGRIRIDAEDLHGAFDGDRVIATLARTGRDRERLAKVELILQRGALKIIGRLHHGFRESWVESLDEKFPFDIELEGRRAAELDDGWIVLVEITGYPSGSTKRSGLPHHRNPTGKISAFTSRMSAITYGQARHSTPKRVCAARQSTFPNAPFRCCLNICPTGFVR